MMRRDYDDWPDIAKSALDAITPADMNICPFYTMPRLDRWAPG